MVRHENLVRRLQMENSKILLKRAIKALKQAHVPDDCWSVGGGTVLAHFYNHRLSKDIDVFLNDAQYLNALSPRVNDLTEDALAYQEQGQFISLTYPEGKVDFIVAAQLTVFEPQKTDFFGEQVYLEDPVEIIVKKIFHRGEFVLARDIFDFAVVVTSNRKADLLNELDKIRSKFDVFKDKVKSEEKFLRQNAYSVRYRKSILDQKYLYGGKEIDYLNNL